MTDIFREVDEDLKREQYEKLWRRYGNYVIAVALAVVLVTAGVVWWRDYQTSRQLAQGDSFAHAIALAVGGERREAADAFAALAEEGALGYATLARFNMAALRAERGDLAGAVAIYDELAKTAVNQTFRDLAVILSAAHSLENADPAELSARLAPLTAADNPWRYSALELTALLAGRSGDSEREREIFTRLAEDPGAPAGIRSRAGEMLQILGG